MQLCEKQFERRARLVVVPLEDVQCDMSCDVKQIVLFGEIRQKWPRTLIGVKGRRKFNGQMCLNWGFLDEYHGKGPIAPVTSGASKYARSVRCTWLPGPRRSRNSILG